MVEKLDVPFEVLLLYSVGVVYLSVDETEVFEPSWLPDVAKLEVVVIAPRLDLVVVEVVAKSFAVVFSFVFMVMVVVSYFIVDVVKVFWAFLLVVGKLSVDLSVEETIVVVLFTVVFSKERIVVESFCVLEVSMQSLQPDVAKVEVVVSVLVLF